MQSYNNQYRTVSVPVMKAWIESYQIPNCMIAEDFWPGNPNNTEPSIYEVATNFINGNGNILNIAYGEPTHWLHVKLTKENGRVNAEIQDSLNGNNLGLIADLQSIGINNVNVVPSAQQPNDFSCGDFTFANTLASYGLIGYNEVFDTAFNLRQQLDRTRGLQDVDYSEYRSQNKFNGSTLPRINFEIPEVIQYLKSNDAKCEIESKFKREIKRIEKQVSNAISKAMKIHVIGGATTEEVENSLRKQSIKNGANMFNKGMKVRSKKSTELANDKKTCEDLALIANYHNNGSFNPEALGLESLIRKATSFADFDYDQTSIEKIKQLIQIGAEETQKKIAEQQIQEQNQTSLISDFNALGISDKQYSFNRDGAIFLKELEVNSGNIESLLDMQNNSTPKACRIIERKVEEGFRNGRF